MGKLFLGQGVENIALIFLCMERFAQQIPAGGGILLNSDIMAGYHIIAAQFSCAMEKLFEFQITVAVNAGIGGQSTFVAPDKLLDDFFLKVAGEVEYIEVHS